MRRLLLAGLAALTLITAGCASGEADAQQDASQDVPAASGQGTSAIALPDEGTPYADARAAIVQAGWQPFINGCGGGGTTEAICQQFPEIGNCSGTGEGLCDMSFTRQEQCLIVITKGGPPQPNGTTGAIVDGTQVVPGGCAAPDSAAAAVQPPPAGLDAAGFAQPVCTRLAAQGIAEAVLIDDFIPAYPAALQDPSTVEQVRLAPGDLAAAVRGLACGAGLSGFGPDVAEAALPLFASKRHGAAAMAALRNLARPGTGVESRAAAAFQDQMDSYLRSAGQQG